MLDQPRLLASNVINQSSLNAAYSEIAEVLDAANIKATAAFVSGFASPYDLLREELDALSEISSHANDWLHPVLSKLSIGASGCDGLLGHKFYTLLKNAGHEIGWHGCTHIPLDWAASPESIELELKLSKRIHSNLDMHPISMVYPRNQTGNSAVFSEHLGLRNFRTSKEHSKISKLNELYKELRSSPDEVNNFPSSSTGIINHPPGTFLNWPGGIRSLIPMSSSVERWREMLKIARMQPSYIHMWFHPHNLITAPKMIDLFRQVIADVADEIRMGNIVNKTMGDFS